MINRFKQAGLQPSTSRRSFLKLVAGTGAGLTLGMNIPVSMAATQQDNHLNSAGEFEANAFVRITPDNHVHVMIKHLEMGQGTFTGLATLVAEELDAAWDQIISEGAPGNAAKYKNLFFGSQGTGGSTAIANSYQQMREAGAAARAMLVGAAATQWQVPATEVSVTDGVVSHAGSGRTATFGELANTAAKQAVPAKESLVLKSPDQFKLIGQSLSRKDLGKNNGTAIFTQDINLDGMLTAVVAHPPRFGATLKSFDDQKARAMTGVVDIFAIPTGVAVVAANYWQAKSAREQLSIEWDESAAMTEGSAELFSMYREKAADPGLPAVEQGDVSQALAGSARVVEADFEFPYLAHAAMEPLNCVAQVGSSGCELWYGAQLHTGDQMAVAKILDLHPEQVKINTLFAGGSFGRRANPFSDYVQEAVQIAKKIPNRPVKMVWSREDDTRAGYFRPLYLHRIKVGLDADGGLTGWDQRIVGQSIAAGSMFESFLVKDGVDSTSVEGAAQPYNFPTVRVGLHTTTVPVPIQWWRSVGHTHTAFSTEVMLDRIATATGKDPYQLRLELLDGHPRHLGVLKLAAEKAGWGRKMPENKALGIAVQESFNSFVAQVAEVTLLEDNRFKVDKVVCAVDCGVAINPEIIKAQMEGGIGYGLSAALHSEITLDQGRVVQSNFHDYQVLRMPDMPEIEVHIVPSAEPPTGVGEPGTPPIAPAVANALYVLTGKEINRLPIRL